MNPMPELKKISDFEDKSLLLVDDDNPFRERLARAMEKKGFEVIQAEGVKKGIDVVKTKKPAFAVVDLRLNDGNGLEVVKHIQNSNENSRIVMLTGYGNIPTAVTAIKEGAIDYIGFTQIIKDAIQTEMDALDVLDNYLDALFELQYFQN